MSDQQNTNRNNKTDRRASRYRLRSFFLGVLALCLLLGVHTGLYFLPDSVARVDLYQSNITRVSEETKAFIRELDRDVTLYWLCEGGEGDGQMEIFLSRYTDANKNGKLTLQVVDSLTDETFSAAYAEGTVGNMSILVESELRSTVVDSADLYIYTNDYVDQMYQSTVQLTYSELTTFYQQFYSAYGYYPEDGSSHIYFRGEALLTAAIDYVTAENVPHGYLLSGHGDVRLPDRLQEMLASYDLSPEPLDLSSAGVIPADADCLILYAPQTDLTEAEATLLDGFLARGGSLLLVTDPAVLKNCPRVAALGQHFGLTAQEGVVIDGDESHTANQSVYQLVPDANQSQDVSYLLSANGITARIPYAHGIAIGDTLPAGVTAKAMLSTSDQGNRVSDDGTQKALGEAGVVHVAVYATRSVTLTDGTTGTAKLAWFGSTQAFEDSVAQEVSYGNDFYFTFSLLSMSQSYTSDFQNMDPLELSSHRMSQLTEAPAIVWMIVLVLVIPICLVVVGIIVWVKRRSR